MKTQVRDRTTVKEMFLVMCLCGIFVILRILTWIFNPADPNLIDGMILVCAFLSGTGFILDRQPFPPTIQVEPERFARLPGIRAGYVYLIKGPKGYYKIGCTKDPGDRYRTFRLNLPFEIEYLHLIPCQDYRSAEALLHRCFAHRRIEGTEWFTLTSDDVILIRTIQTL